MHWWLQQQYDRYIILALRLLQLLLTIIALVAIGGGFKGNTVAFTQDNGDIVNLTVYYGGPTVNFVLLVTFSAVVYCLFWLWLVHMRQAIVPPVNTTVAIDSVFTVFLLSGGCALAGSDYVRYCSLLSAAVHCGMLKTGAVFCLLAFVVFLVSVAWSFWMKMEKSRQQNQHQQKEHPGNIRPYRGEDIPLDNCGDSIDIMERSTSSLESNTYLQATFVR